MTFQWIRWALLAVTISAAACTKEQNACKADSDCTNPAYPFCDVNGEFEASGGAKNVCTIVPADCPVERCGCSPGAARCETDTLTTCDADGMSESSVMCALGCGGSTAHCLSFVPLNGLAVALTAAGTSAEVSLPPGVMINTSTGEVKTSGGLPINVPSVVVDQAGATIRAFYGSSVSLSDVHVVGTAALALVSANDLEVDGVIDASGANIVPGPGALAMPHPCAGGASTRGGGGGGNAISGSNGGLGAGPGGIAEGSLDTNPLVGGCNGGPEVDDGGTVLTIGGGGGGAVQLVAGASIQLSANAMINVGAGGGMSAAGGGSGGNVIIEAPSVMFALGARLVANGGAGGACTSQGEDASTDTTPANGGGPCGMLPYVVGGHGGTVASAPSIGTIGGGGGGSVGQLLVRTRDGQIMDGGATISAAAAMSVLPVGQ
jgi:hypothetical protein